MDEFCSPNSYIGNYSAMKCTPNLMIEMTIVHNL